ncbi:MAG: 4-hydroxy-3-methylbut-2-enyl diphosphate reductase, partial [Clostridia bacterium]|nr:4-hydroxy-3-methylbut-2-enyl diphosphate reductase [Clostridia bacterium]
MEIKVGKNAGFCFGVRRAVDAVTELAKKGGARIRTVGELIHNGQVLRELEELGVRSIDAADAEREAEEAAGAGERIVFVIRTHGVEKSTEEKLAELSEKYGCVGVTDLTCPYVKKIHGIAERNPGARLVVFGDPSHPEVRGIVSRAGEKGYTVLTSAEDLDGMEIYDGPAVFVSQTTQSTEKLDFLQKKLSAVFTNAEKYDTICGVTENRQREAAELASECDLMLVVGSRQSSNTAKLYEISKSILSETYLIETPSDLPDNIKNHRRIGITAGASSPMRLIREVIKTMSENINEVTSSKDFAEMIENSMKILHAGDVVSGVVSAVSGNELHVDVGAKVTGVITAEEAAVEPGTKLSDIYKVGDSIDAIVTKVNDREGVADLSKKRVDAIIRRRRLAELRDSGEIVEGEVVGVNKGGIEISFEGTRVFVPAKHTGVPRSGDLSALVGQTKRFKIKEIEEGRRGGAVGDISCVERAERKAKVEEFWRTIEIGKFYEGEVRSITSFGVFVDLGGVDGMIHSSELSWTHIKSPADVVSVGDVIRVFVKDVDIERKRISLGFKTEETNPWNVFKANYSVNDIIKTKIVSIADFGAFAEIIPGVDGLIHISQVSDHKVGSVSEVLKKGQEVTAEITSINDEKHQVALSIRSLL